MTKSLRCTSTSMSILHARRTVWHSAFEQESEVEALAARIRAMSVGDGSERERLMREYEELAGEPLEETMTLQEGVVSVEALLGIARNHTEPMTLTLNEEINKRAVVVQKRFAEALSLTPVSSSLTRSIGSLQRLFKDTAENTARFASKKEEGDATALMVKANAKSLEDLCARHDGVVETLTEIFASGSYSANAEKLLAALYADEIALSILVQHGADLTSRKHPHEFGVVRVNEPLHGVLDHASTLVTALAGHNYSDLELPSIEISPAAADVRLTCIPSVVEFAVVETLKNAVYATMEHHRKVEMEELPSVLVEVSEDASTLNIDIFDSGPGISPAAAARAYGFAGAASTSSMVDEQTSYQPVSSPLRGFHVGIFLISRFLSSTNSGNFSLMNRPNGIGALARIALRKPL